MVIPVHDLNPVHRTPIVTYLFILLNIAIFLVQPTARAPLTGRQTVAQFCEQEAFFERWAAIPRELTENTQLPPQQDTVETDAGPVTCPAPEPYEKTPVLSVLFAMFLHGGWLHLIGNMLFLYVFGNNVEDRLGRVLFPLFYVACGYVATYAFALTDPDSTTTLVGASGAIAGVLGAYLLLYPRAKVTSLMPFLFFLPIRLPAWIVLGSWFLLQYLYAEGSGVNAATGGGVAYWAHVAGFVAGMVLILPALARGRPPAPRRGGRPPAWR